VQRGNRVLVDFTISELTTDGLGLRLSGVELRLGTTGPGGDIDAWAAAADRIEVTAAGPGPQHTEAPIAKWTGQPVWLAVRTASHKGKWGAWSNVVAMEVVPEVRLPRVQAESAPQGVRLTWTFDQQRAGQQVRIYRKRAAEQTFAQAAVVAGGEWIDREARFGEPVEYAVQAVIGSAESERGEPQKIIPEDRFAPAIPTGLTAIAGIAGVELSWEPNTESDAAGYILFRAAEGEANLAPLTERIAPPSYSDRQVKAGVKYRYAVRSVDQQGNQSALCAPVEVTAPEPMF
jgi:hypothetical protein